MPKSVSGQYAHIWWATMLVFESVQGIVSNNVYANHENDQKYYLVYRVNNAFLINIARNRIITSPKTEFCYNHLN